MKPRFPTWLAVVCLAALSGGCGRQATPPPGPDLVGQAAAEATAIVQRAQATALVLQAQAQATALVAGAGASPANLPPAPTRPAEPVPVPTEVGEPTDEGGQAEEETGPGDVQVLSASLAAEGGFVIVNFAAPPQEATRWYQGLVWVVDEATGTVYNEIPVMPVVGPLIGRPVEAGQPGYVMLVNAPVPLRVGAVVTVVLGEHRFEHVPIE